MLNQQLLN